MLPKTEVLQRKEAETTNGTVVFEEKDTDVEGIKFTPTETFNDFIIVAMMPQKVSTIALPNNVDANTDYGVIVGKNSKLPEHEGLDFGCTVELIGKRLKVIENTGDIIESNFDLYLYRTGAVVRKLS